MDNKHNESSHMYFKDYATDLDINKTVKHNHKTGAALLAKVMAKLRGRAGRWRGKNGTQENNKARGGKQAR